MAELDVSRMLRGELAVRTLVETAAEQGDQIERHYLEIKSDVDVRTKAGAAKVAKFVLGAANRTPAVANRAFEGYAVMVLGVGKGAVTGVDRVEVMDIAKAITPYLGSDGPHWDIQRLPIADSDKEVLLIIVDPPVSGQDAFVCHKEGDGLTNGGIYVRSEGETRPAHADELKQLFARGRSRPAEVQLDVQVVGTAVRCIVDDDATLRVYLEQERNRLMAAMSSSSSPMARSISNKALAYGAAVRPEERSSAQYLAEIEAWEKEVTRSWVSAVNEVAGRLLSGVAIELSNRTDAFLSDVELTVHVEGDIDGVDWLPASDGTAWNTTLLPTPPRAWGPRKSSQLFDARSIIPASISAGFSIPSTLRYQNSGSVTLTVAVGDLRPRQTYRTEVDRIVLLVRDPALQSAQASWQVTTRGRDEVYEGDIVVKIDPSFNATAAMAKVLCIDSGSVEAE